MPRGITQEQVNQAADVITAGGARPTVERVRAHLGTGSPNTVTRMLDAWRQGLSERLRQASLLPELPDEVGQAMTVLWTQALQHAREHTQKEVQSERNALQQSRTALEEREVEQTALVASANEDAQRSGEAARHATAQVETLQRLVERLDAELKEQAQERTRLLTQNQALETTNSRLRDEIRATAEKSSAERAAADEHIKVVEDRAHVRIDSARTDIKALRAELVDVRRQHRNDERALQGQVNNLAKALATSEREISRQRGIAEALTPKLGKTRHPAPRKPTRRKKSSAKPPSTLRD